jgi:hypothetical protein
MMTKHKHCDLIKAWADGAEIQSTWLGGNDWEDDLFPTWAINKVYRIKPEERKPVVRWLWALNDGSVSMYFMTEDQAHNRGWPIKLEWSRQEFPE